MNCKDLVQNLRSGRMTRRQFAAGLAGLGLATVMVRPRLAAAAAADLQVFTWAGYDIPELHQAYIGKHGGSPSFALLASAEEAFQKLRAGFVTDITHPCVENIATWNKAGLIKPLDTARLEHWNDLFPELFSLPGAVIDGQHFFLPFDWGNGSLLYRTDKVEIEEESWSLAFDERYKGQISMYNSKPAVTVAALVLGIDPFNFTEAEGERIHELMRKQRELVLFYWESPAQYQQAMASGEIYIAYAWNDGLKELRKQGVPVKYMVPKEGILNWTCGLVHMANGPAPDDLVYDFLNAMTDPETGKYMIEQYNYGHANRKAFDIADKAQLESLAFTEPQNLFQTGVFETEVTPEMERRRNKILEDVRMGL